MAIAAVPEYLGQDFKDASPGMRFGMYLRLWGTNERSGELLWNTHDIVYRVRGKNKQERELKEDTKRSAIDAACIINPSDGKALEGVLARQQTLVASIPGEAMLIYSGESVAPFTTGLGNEHPLENGFAFLWPHGLPYLPGSGVKGVLRQAARELAGSEWGDSRGWSTEKKYQAAGIPLSLPDLLFGLESGDGGKEHFRGLLFFWDVIPQIKDNRLMVEVMTPHQKHYYQDGQPPHDSRQPIPIAFLTVPPGSRFAFYVQCDNARLQRIAPELAVDGHWKEPMEAVFQHAFDWLGFGAKTAVGYGQMAKSKEQTAGSGSHDAAGDQGETWENVVLTLNPGSGELSTTRRGIVASVRNPEAQKLRDGLPSERKARLKKKKELKGCTIRVEKQGNAWRLAEIIAVN